MTSYSDIFLPRQYVIDARVNGNVIQQLRAPDRLLRGVKVQEYKRGRVRGFQATALGDRVIALEKNYKLPEDVSQALRTADGSFLTSDDAAQEVSTTWLKPRASKETSTTDPEAVRNSWRGQFTFLEEETLPDGTTVPGLRPPQVGALHATLAHWKVTQDPATIVMPTGTGKTETMLALLIQQRIPRLLVVVPNDTLRTQIGEKFLTLGLLKQFEVVGEGAQYPVVGLLKKQLKTAQQATEVFEPCNVVVTTMQVLSGCSEEARQEIVSTCTHLIIDEAHHVSAPTWEEVRRAFSERAILQFTATPFRNDRKHVDGAIIFNYPLRKAQHECYFRPIAFGHVWEFNPERADRALAAMAAEALRRDLEQNLDHLVMARANTVERAEQVLAAYKAYPEFNPVLIHSNLPQTDKRGVLKALRGREARIVVCVNMFGEGFDLPELKIAALHDPHKSLAITLQFTGRFTRSKVNVGGATVLANLADTNVQEALRALYAEDADWNALLRDLSEGATTGQYLLSKFFKDFQYLPKQLPLQNITPKMSTVVYRTSCAEWNPDGIAEVVKDTVLLEPPAVNHRARVAAYVTRSQIPVDWGHIRDLQDTEWDLFLLHWDEAQNLLFINSNASGTSHEELAAAVGGDDAQRVTGEPVFRTLHGINRLTLTNLGLSHTIGRATRFTMFMGSDIIQGLSEAQQLNKTKSNLFGFGFRGAKRASAGCSVKGKLWSYRIAGSIPEWLDWCHEVGDRLLDDTISIDDILSKVIKYEPLHGRPNAVPIAIEWSPTVLDRPEATIRFDINGEVAYLYEVGVALTTFDDTSPICFKVFTETQEAHYEMTFEDGNASYQPLRGTVTVLSARKAYTLSGWLQKEPPTVFFHDRSLIQYNLLAKLVPIEEPFSRERIEAWDWTGTNIRRESQGIERDPDTVQYRVIQEVLKEEFQVVFDDDNSYEAADVVALRATDDALSVRLYHCKFSGGELPGQRIKDLYEVCGQAQKSVHWRDDVEQLIEHLRYREGERQRKHSVTRFMRGDLQTLRELQRRAHYLKVDFRIYVVQPGLSQSQATPDQLDLLAVTELYLKETYEIPLTVIGNG